MLWKHGKRYSVAKGCVLIGRQPKGYTTLNIFILFLHFFCICGISYLMRQSSSSTMPGPSLWTHLPCQLPPPWPARPSLGKRHWVLVAAAAMAGHAFTFSEYQGCHRGPSCTDISGLDLGTRRRQLCREAEQQWKEMHVCPSPYVYWGNRCINKSKTQLGAVVFNLF